MKISFVNGSRSGDTVEFSVPEITIGREDDNILRLPTEGVSRYHARLHQNAAGVWSVIDRGSTNGVKRNGVRIFGEREIFPGDELTIGEQTIRIESFSTEPPKVIFNPIPSHTTVISPEELGVAESDAPEVAPGVAIESKARKNGAEKSKLKSTAPELDIEAEESPREEDSSAEPAGAIAQALRSGAFNLFGGKGGGVPPSDSGSAPADAGQAPAGKRRGISNLTFYTILGCLVVVVIVACLRGIPGMTPEAPPQPVETPRPGLTMEYSKKIITDDNIFRFALVLEIPEDREKPGKAEFTIDDIGSLRCFRKEFEVGHETLDLLRGKIDSSGIWTMKAPDAVRDPGGTYRSLVLAEEPRVVRFELGGQYLPPELEKVETAVTDFAETYGLQTISLTPEELLSLARNAFGKAEDLYDNREAKLSNLRDAIIRYQLVVNYLEQFSPPPPMWDRARKKLKEAEALRRRKLDALELERVRLGNIRDLHQMRQVFLQIMELMPADSKEFDTARQRLFKLDQHLGDKKR